MLRFPIQLNGVALGTCGLGLLLANIVQSTHITQGESIIRVVVVTTTSLSICFLVVYIFCNVLLQGPRVWLQRELNSPHQCSAFGALIMHLSLIAYILVNYIPFGSPSFYISHILGYFAAIIQILNMTLCGYLLRCIAVKEKLSLLSLIEPYFNPVIHSITMSAIGIPGDNDFAIFLRSILTGIGICLLLPSTLTQAYRVLNDDAIANDTSIALLQAAPSMVLVGWLLVPTVTIYNLESTVAHILFIYASVFYVATIYAIVRRRKRLTQSMKHFTLSSFTFPFVNTANATIIYFDRNYNNKFDSFPLYWSMRIYSLILAVLAICIVLYVLSVYTSRGLFLSSSSIIDNDENDDIIMHEARESDDDDTPKTQITVFVKV